MTRDAVPVVIALASALSVSTHASDTPAQTLYFEEVEGAFPEQGCAGGDPADEGCWTNYLRLSDLDGDGDLDAIFPNARGFFSSPGAQPLEVYLNDGAGSFAPGTATLLGGEVVGAYRVAAIGDVDGDGRRDLFLPSASGEADRLYVQGDDGTFVDEAEDRIGSASRSAAARFGDVDADGDLDLLVASGYASSDVPPARLYRNDGGGVFALDEGALPGSILGVDPVDVDFVDVDGDFDVDVLVNAHELENALWINDGTGRFVDESFRLPLLEGFDAFHYGPAACDLDGDGDRDIVVDNIAYDYREEVLINDGGGVFSSESDRLGGNPRDSDDNGLVCLDFDDDGDLDLVVVALTSNGERLLENDGTGRFTLLEGAFTALVDPSLWMEAGDVDGDGRLDVVTAQGEGDVQIERLYLGTDEVAVDTSPPRVFATSGRSWWPEIRFAIQDNTTSDEGPRVRSVEARLPRDAVVPATFMGGDLYRVVVPSDATEVSLCATDAAGNVGCAAIEEPGAGGAGGGVETTTGSGEGAYTPSVVASVGTGGAEPSTPAAATSGQPGAGGDEAIAYDARGGCALAPSGVAPHTAVGVGWAALAVATRFARRRRDTMKEVRS